MPLQNRIDPYGRLQAVEARGAWLGNRGVLHNDAGKIVAQWRLKRWITCLLSFKDRHREVFAPRRYSQLFFLDEATAFSAGHRPCAECRRERFNDFRSVWMLANSERVRVDKRLSVDQIDDVLHTERVTSNKGKQTYRSQLGALPSGTMIEIDNNASLIWNGGIWPWSFAGYGKPGYTLRESEEVTVLTPQSIVRAYANGLVPEVHVSAGNAGRGAKGFQ